MSAAVIGLIGVIIGGVLTGGVEFALEHRREKRRGQAAARLVHAALTDIDSFVKASLVRRAWLGDPADALSDAQWLEQRAILAEAPGFDGWYPVAGAWGWIAQLHHLVELFQEGVADDPLENRDQDFFEIGLLMVGISDQALLDYAKTKTYSDPPESEPTSLQQELDAIFKQASKKDDSESASA
jgi:hypothetical protein